ncbi:hypothetical protein EON83_12380 [bacterium]|nr:MAG: hypothetical protein EON83_12380 [bacterium]
MPHTQPHQAPSHSLLKPAYSPQREINIYASIHANEETWKVLEPCAVEINDAFETFYRVEMEIVSSKTSNHFDVTIYVDWERYYPNTKPSKDVLFGLARNLLRDHLTDNQYPPRFTSGGFIELRWPELDEYEGTV